jgi:CheY-like chemotaxis protein
MSEARTKADDASRLKSDFLAHMSHEIRTPMNGVIGLTDLLLETDLDERQRDYAETVRSSGKSLLTIIDGILDFSKIEAGRVDVEDVDFSPSGVVGDVVDLMAATTQAKGLELSAVIDPTVPATVTGDPNRVRQVLTNLLSNALKFTERGGVVIRVATAETAAPGSLIRFEISDTGVGIGADKLAAVFAPFVQADSSTSRKFGGTGLGLPISTGLVELMGGEFGATSIPGEGSTFWFTVRVGESASVPEPQAEEARPAASPASERIAGSGRLLLVEDNLINQKVAVAMLSSAGYEVDTALSGAAAVAAVASHSYDAILMDCQMPEMNGYEATAAIRAHELPGGRTPIIALTAGARNEDRERCLAAGMDDYLSKPVNKATLLAVVAHSMAGTG